MCLLSDETTSLHKEKHRDEICTTKVYQGSISASKTYDVSIPHELCVVDYGFSCSYEARAHQWEVYKLINLIQY